MAERILIVDDEEGSRELCHDFLETDGYTLDLAEGGAAALRLMERSGYHLVVTDLNMPQMTGLDLLRAVRQHYPATEVILITAYGEIKTAVEAMRDGAFDYITKPFSKDIFRFTVQRCLEKQRLAEQLKTAQMELAQKEKLALIGGLAAGVAHRLRNPLNIILMCAQYLKGRFPLGDDRQEVALAIEDKVKILERTAKSLIEYSRSSHPIPAPTDLHHVLEVVLHGFATRLKIQGVAVQRQFAKTWPPLPLDGELIEEAFINIIDNALDVMGDHGTLTIRTDKDAQQARVEFINTGPGLAPELREKIFEPFFTTKEGGVGLGLTIAQRIVEEHHGSIAVDSHPKQQTTTITVRLPLEPFFRCPTS